MIRLLPFVLCLLVWGCSPTPPPANPLGSATGRAAALEANLQRSSQSANDLSVQLDAEATAGAAATPAAAVEAHQHWAAVKTLAAQVKSLGGQLLSLVGDVTAIRSDVAGGQKQIQTLTDQLEKANSQNMKTLRFLQVLAVIGIGAAVVILILFKNISWSMALGGGCLAMAVAVEFLKLLQEMMGVFKWVLWIGFAVCLLWFLIDWYLRKDWRKALYTDPITDIRDLLQKIHGSQPVLQAPTVGDGGAIGDLPPDPLFPESSASA